MSARSIAHVADGHGRANPRWSGHSATGFGRGQDATLGRRPNPVTQQPGHHQSGSHQVDAHPVVVPPESEAGIEGDILVGTAQYDLVAARLAGEVDEGPDDGRPGPFALVAWVRGHVLDMADRAPVVDKLVFEY